MTELHHFLNNLSHLIKLFYDIIQEMLDLCIFGKLEDIVCYLLGMYFMEIVVVHQYL
jgi:hypothetical protein